MNVLFHDDATFSGNDCDASDCEHVRDCDVSGCDRDCRAFLLELLYFQNQSLKSRSRVNGFLYKVFHDDGDAIASAPMNADGLHDDCVNSHGDHHWGHYARYLG